MIGKINRGTDFYGLVSYVFQDEKKAQRVYGNFWEAIAPELNIKGIAKQFSNQAALNRRVKQPVYHVSISPSYEEASQLDAIGWSEVAEKFVEMMNFDQNLVMGVLHHDTYFPNTNKLRPHLHLIINTVDVATTKCSNTYYDYYLVENLLRNLEENLSIKREAESKLESETHSRNNDFNEPQAKDNGELLIYEIEKLDELASKIGTHEPDINGLDVAAYTITSISSLAKVAALFVKKARSDEDISQLAQLVDNLEEFKQLNPQHEKLKLPAVSVEEISVRCLPEFISDAEQFVNKANKLLLPAEEIEETNSIFDKFINYFHSIDDLKNRLNQEKYQVRGKILGEVILNNSPDNKNILIKVGDDIVYKSEFENQNQQWLTSVDRLGDREKELVNELPQSPQEASKKQLEVLCAKCLNHLFDRDNASPTITCQFKSETLEFDRLKFADGTALIRGFSAENRLVFNARISLNKAVSVSKNQISTERLEELVHSIKQNFSSRSQSHSSHFKKNITR